MTKARKHPTTVHAVRGSEAARRKAALLLEAWSGVRSTLAASEAMGVALPRFYQLEARALQLIVAAMEPRPRGRQVTPESKAQKLEAEVRRLQRDVERFQALYRTAQRTLGLVVAKTPQPEKNATPGGKRRRGPRKKARGQTVAAVLRDTNFPKNGDQEGRDGATDQGSGARGWPGGRRAGQGAAEVDPVDAAGGATGPGGPARAGHR